jgi:hypothetical protein
MTNTLTPTEVTLLRRIAAATRGYCTIGSTETARLRSLRLRGYIEKMPKSRVNDK